MKTLWTNGSIVKLEDEKTYDWILTENDKILDLGFKEDEPIAKEVDSIFDLEDFTLMTSFIDSHSHFSANVFSFTQIDLSEAKNFKDIKDKIKQFIKENDIKEDAWITGVGYDHNDLAEKEHPNKKVLDDVSLTNPIVINHVSGHMGVLNSKALDYFEINKDTESPPGGNIQKDENGPTGYIEENAFIEIVKSAPMPSMDSIKSSVKKAEERYFSYGITTAQEGMTVKELIPLYDLIINESDIDIDIIYYTSTEDNEEILKKFPKTEENYENHIKFGGVKLFLDGSPQGKTAWLREPYKNEEEYLGYGTLTDKQLYEGLKFAYDKNFQPLAHCNGDAAIAQYIKIVRKLKNEGRDLAPLRPIIIHAQMLGKDQIKDVVELGMIPSFFLAHILHWGDVHIENLGMERASAISPAKSALDSGLKFTLHQDSPVILPDMIETLSVAVNRKTKSGVVLGESEKISIKDAIKAITINAAHQYFEEDIKGSLEKGKRADFVMLSENPLNVSDDKIKDIKVLKTVKSGKVVYSID